MDAGELDDETLFRTLEESGARALLIGRRALIALGAPVMTADYDFWVHWDDIEKLNAAFDGVSHAANRSPEEARKTGRYVLENGERIDVMVARGASTPDGELLTFDDAWARRVRVEVAAGVHASLPCTNDLITTKRWGSRPRDQAAGARLMPDPLDDFWETPLAPEEFARREAEGEAALDGPEGEAMLETIAWFRRRYPTPLARIAYIRRKMKEAEAWKGRAKPNA